MPQLHSSFKVFLIEREKYKKTISNLSIKHKSFEILTITLNTYLLPLASFGPLNNMLSILFRKKKKKTIILNFMCKSLIV